MTSDIVQVRYLTVVGKYSYQQKVLMTDIPSMELLNDKLWEEVANCFADTENLDGENEMGQDRFELSDTSSYKYLNQAMNNVSR